MLVVVLGITYGSLIGCLCNYMLFQALDERKRLGQEPLEGIGKIFFLRYAIDFMALILFWLLTRSAYGLIAVGLSITVAVKISLLIVYRRKGGKF